jgi:CHAT domain-containing protein
MTQHRKHTLWLALIGSASLLPACATVNDASLKEDRLELGRNADGDPCAATITRLDEDTRTDPSDVTFRITCRTATASRTIGFLRSTSSAQTLAKIEETLACGASRPAQIAGVGEVAARRCIDRGVGDETVVLTARSGTLTFVGSAQASAQGPLEDGIRQLLRGPTSKDVDRTTQPSIAFRDLPPAPQLAAAGNSRDDFDPEVALRTGTTLNQRGLHAEAARALNDALSRTDENVTPSIRANLNLEAALADSNIRFSDSAAQRFAEADRIIAQSSLTDSELLLKRSTFQALDLLNRRSFENALAAADRVLAETGSGSGQPLQDAAVLGALNQPPPVDTRDLNLPIAPGRTVQKTQLTLIAQAYWARSNALRGLRRPQEAQEALDKAFRTFNLIERDGPQQAPLLWLKARLERQAGRLAAARGDWSTANQSFDAAVAALEEAAALNNWTGREPAIADTMLERATMRARQGAPAEQVRDEYGKAVQAMILAKAAGSIDPTGIERYLDLLVEEARSAPREDTYDRFFVALQAIGEPAIARQINRIQAVVAADPALGPKFREREALESRLTSIRYRLISAPAGERASLDEEQAAAQRQLAQLEQELVGSARANSLDERPVSVSDIRQELREGEVYFKITPLNRRAYGVVIDRQKTQIYPIEAPLSEMGKLATEIRNSIDGAPGIERESIPRFRVPQSYALFRLISGPAAETLTAAKSIIVEPSGPLERLPLGVLITDQESVRRYQPRLRSKNVNEVYNYSDLSFLASGAELSTSVSPRSFLVARKRQSSSAPNPFIGFAEHSPQSAAKWPATGLVRVGESCFADAARLRELLAGNAPIQRNEVTIAKTALGVPQAPVLAGAAFTDEAVEQRSDLNSYQVLHFATHGLEEGVFGCPSSPSALLTSVGDADSDGLLSFDEVAALSLDANLVVLSACDTAAGASGNVARASGQEEGGTTLEGLVRAFLTANSRAVLATYWSVSAASETDELVRTFYGAARSQNIGASLRTAQQQLLRNPEFSHPFYWGAYFVVGDARNMMLSTPQQQAGRQAASR